MRDKGKIGKEEWPEVNGVRLLGQRPLNLDQRTKSLLRSAGYGFPTFIKLKAQSLLVRIQNRNCNLNASILKKLDVGFAYMIASVAYSSGREQAAPISDGKKEMFMKERFAAIGVIGIIWAVSAVNGAMANDIQFPVQPTECIEFISSESPTLTETENVTMNVLSLETSIAVRQANGQTVIRTLRQSD